MRSGFLWLCRIVSELRFERVQRLGVDLAGDLLAIGVHCRQHQRPAFLAYVYSREKPDNAHSQQHRQAADLTRQGESRVRVALEGRSASGASASGFFSLCGYQLKAWFFARRERMRSILCFASATASSFRGAKVRRVELGNRGKSARVG
jgi:hypothetical protein